MFVDVEEVRWKREEEGGGESSTRSIRMGGGWERHSTPLSSRLRRMKMEWVRFLEGGLESEEEGRLMEGLKVEAEDEEVGREEWFEVVVEDGYGDVEVDAEADLKVV